LLLCEFYTKLMLWCQSVELKDSTALPLST
jgi:hypothetical protein